MAPKKQQEPDTKLVAFYDIHVAMLDFLMKRLGQNRRRNDHVRNAVMQYVLAQSEWNPKLFREFVEETAVHKVPRTGNRRAVFLDDVDKVCNEPTLPAMSIDSKTMDFDL